MNRAPGQKLVPSSIMTGPLGPLTLMGFVQAHAPGLTLKSVQELQFSHHGALLFD